MKKIESSKTDGRDKPEKVRYCTAFLFFSSIASVTVSWPPGGQDFQVWRAANGVESSHAHLCYGRMFLMITSKQAFFLFSASSKCFSDEKATGSNSEVNEILGLLQCTALAARFRLTVRRSAGCKSWLLSRTRKIAVFLLGDSLPSSATQAAGPRCSIQSSELNMVINPSQSGRIESRISQRRTVFSPPRRGDTGPIAHSDAVTGGGGAGAAGRAAARAASDFRRASMSTRRP